MSVQIIENSQNSKDNFGNSYAVENIEITKNELEALKDGKLLAFKVNGDEYSVFINLKQKSDDDRKVEFLKIIREEINKLTQVFNFDYVGFNTDGGTGYQLDIKCKNYDEWNSIFIWFDNKNGIDMCPEEFELEKLNTYTLRFQVQIKGDTEIGSFTDVDSAIQYYKDNIELYENKEDIKYYMR